MHCLKESNIGAFHWAFASFAKASGALLLKQLY
jgi:hypothetical protein